MLGANTTTGYGSQVTVQNLSTGTVIQSQPWVTALGDIRRCWIHQQGTLVGFPTVAAIAAATESTDLVTAEFVNTVQTLVNTIQTNSAVVAGNQLARAESTTESTGTWTTLLAHSVDSVFATAADADYFFNSGGSLAYELSYTTSTAVWNTQTQAWAATLAWAAPAVAAARYTRSNWRSGSRSTTTTLTSGSNRIDIGFVGTSTQGIRSVLTITNVYTSINILVTSTAVVRYSVDTEGVVDSTDLVTYTGVHGPQPTQAVGVNFGSYQAPVVPTTRTLSVAFVGGSSVYTVESGGAAVTKTVNITNSGNSDCTVSAITFNTQYPVSDTATYSLGWAPVAAGGTGIIAAGTTVSFVLGYSAVGAATTYATNSFVIQSDNDAGPISVTPTVVVTDPAYSFVIDPNPLVFAWTGESNLGAYFTAIETNGTGFYAGSSVGTDPNTWDSVGTGPNQLRVRFKPAGVNYVTGSYSAVLNMTMAGPTTVSNTASITINYTAPATAVTQHIGSWVSALQNDNGVIGVSYDIIRGHRYITIGYGMNADGGGTVAATYPYTNIDVGYLGTNSDVGYTLGPVLYPAVTNYAYDNFLQPYSSPGNLDGHGVWINDSGWSPVGSWISRTYTFYTTQPGSHTYRFAVDNLGYFTINGGIVADRSDPALVGTYSPVTGSVYIDSTGYYEVTIYMYNTDNGYYNNTVNPGAVALEINDPTGFTVWSTQTPVRSTAPYLYWNEVYRIPVDDNIPRYSKDYLIKSGNSAGGNTYESYFGQTGTVDEGSMFVVSNDGSNNITITLNDQYRSTTDTSSQTTMSYTRYLFYYYSQAGQRLTDLESNAGDGNTRYFQGFYSDGTAKTTRVIIPTPAGGGGAGAGGGGGGGGCPDPATPITVNESGHTRLAGELAVGDTVWTRHESTGVPGNYAITAIEIVQQPRVRIQFDDGTDMIVSDTHKFLTWDLAWRQVFQLAVGDTIKGLDINKTIASMEAIGIGPVVKMTVDQAHTYIAGGLISHNVKIIGGDSLL